MIGLSPPAEWDDWELSQRLQSVHRLASRGVRDQRRTSWDPEHVVRVDRSHGGRRHAESGPTVADDAAEPAAEIATRGTLAWLAPGLGLACLTCGGLLTATGLFESRSALWNVGLPLVVLGQLVLLLGVTFRLRQATRAARARLLDPITRN